MGSPPGPVAGGAPRVDTQMYRTNIALTDEFKTMVFDPCVYPPDGRVATR